MKLESGKSSAAEAKTEDRMRGGGDHHHRTTDAYPFPFLQRGESELDGGVAHDARWRNANSTFYWRTRGVCGIFGIPAHS